MAICLQRFAKGFSGRFFNARHHASFCEKRSVQAMLIPAQIEISECSNIQLRRQEEGNIWMRGMPHREISELKFSTSVVPFTPYEKSMILLANANRSDSPQQNTNDNPGRADEGQLEYIHQKLAQGLPLLFVKAMDYTIFHPQLIFENNIRGTRTVGIYHFVKLVSILRLVGHLRFAYVKFEILKITSHTEDATVRVRWRVRGLSGLKVMMHFWRYKFWDLDGAFKELESWYDGYSTFYVGADGLVYKHIVDKMMPDDDANIVTSSKTPLAAKVALLMGLIPRECFAELPDTYLICQDDIMLPLEQLE